MSDMEHMGYSESEPDAHEDRLIVTHDKQRPLVAIERCPDCGSDSLIGSYVKVDGKVIEDIAYCRCGWLRDNLQG